MGKSSSISAMTKITGLLVLQTVMQSRTQNPSTSPKECRLGRLGRLYADAFLVPYLQLTVSTGCCDRWTSQARSSVKAPLSMRSPSNILVRLALRSAWL